MHETPVTLTIPQEVQRLVVEHVVKHDHDYQGHVPLSPKLRVFSGHSPKPNGEVDFTKGNKRRHVLDSLLPPALNVALEVGTNAPPEVYVLELGKAYGSVTGGDKLYIQFIETHQNRGEKPSEYLRRLHSLMQEVVEKKGCWDEVLITQLHLKDFLTDSSQSELSYSSLIFKLRSYKHEKQLKEKCMNLHLCTPPTRAQSQRPVDLRRNKAKRESHHALCLKLNLSHPLLVGFATAVAKTLIICNTAQTLDRTHCAFKLGVASVVERTEAAVVKSSIEKNNQVHNGLIGEPWESKAWLDGIECHCLIDTVSQVTCVAASFYKQYLQHRGITPMGDLLRVEGAAGQIVPYIRYIEIDVQFPKPACGTDVVVTALALICPDQAYNAWLPLLVGTMYSTILFKIGNEYLQHQPISANLMAAYRICDNRGMNKTMIIGEPLMHHIPGGLVVECKLIQAELCARNKVKPKGVIAECLMVDWIKSVPLFDDTATSQATTSLMANLLVKTGDPVTLDFGDSSISEEFKAHILERINCEASCAFTKHDLDVGHVSGVAHRIELIDHIPFKERTRRVSPADFEDLRKHLLDLLASELIEESNSPYASPVVLVRKKNGDLRMVADYRKLNKLTKRDAYPIYQGLRRHLRCCQAPSGFRYYI
ncbi:hypothetical protein H4Q32_030019 [Labeo rohita]|uniref:Paraneoplastic antigen Ma-like C-terminal domain-containing protein n=1 Tax=Labeo rohita TaxID=84645 RepID=A0ABQ8L2S6_LABRO|nr:hypothetical protein H4Q32_030019 [Labeo rohita]